MLNECFYFKLILLIKLQCCNILNAGLLIVMNYIIHYAYECYTLRYCYVYFKKWNSYLLRNRNNHSTSSASDFSRGMSSSEKNSCDTNYSINIEVI